MTYLNDFIQKIAKVVGDKSKAYSSTFQINSNVASMDKEGGMEMENVDSNYISFSANEIIPVIENSKLM